MSEPGAPLSAEARNAEARLWDKAPAWRTLIVAASLLTLAAVATPMLLPGGGGLPSQTAPSPTAVAPLPNLPVGTKIVPSGELDRVNRHSRYNPSLGGDMPITITILTQPAHGTVTIQQGTATVTFPNMGVTRVSAVTNVFYQSAPGYVGQDSFTYKRVSTDPRDPQNAKVFTVNIYARPASEKTASGAQP